MGISAIKENWNKLSTKQKATRVGVGAAVVAGTAVAIAHGKGNKITNALTADKFEASKLTDAGIKGLDNFALKDGKESYTFGQKVGIGFKNFFTNVGKKVDVIKEAVNKEASMMSAQL